MIKTLLAILTLTGCVAAKIDKYVKITLDTKWKQTPLVLEASEYLADKSNKDFWSFVDKIQGNNLKTDKDQYTSLIKQASSILSPQEIDVLKFSLSIRTYSPRVQLHHQLASQLNKDCEVFFQFSEEGVTCDLEEALKSAQSSLETLLQKFDHVYPGTESNKNIFIVYGDISKNSFATAHKTILQKLSELNLKYALRHNYKTSEDTSKVRLSGYGVELAVKSTEYKAVDDQKVEDTKKAEKLEGKNDDEVQGFLFNRLRELHPTLKDDLDKFKTHLKEANQELSPLKVWQLQDLSFQAAQRVKSASSVDALKVLKDISENVPMLARTLVKTKVSDNLRNEINENQKEFEKNGIAAGDASFYINGIDIPVDDLNAFQLLEVLKSETKSMALLSHINLDKSKSGKLLSLNVKPEQESLIVDTRSDSVQWINDLENDDQYSYWPRNLQEILRPTFPGMLRYIAQNIFNAILYMNPTNKECIDLYLQFQQFLDNQVPLRFGIVFVSDGSAKDEPEENVGAAIIRAFSFIKADKDARSAFNFLTKLYQSNGQKAPSAEDVIKKFSEMYGETEAGETLGIDSEYDDLRRVSKIVFDNIGIKSLPQVLINGQQMSKDDLKKLEVSIVEKVLSQTPPIQQAVYMGSNFGYPSIYDYIMSQPNVVTRLNSIIQKLDGKFANAGNFDGDIDNHEELKSLTKEQAVGAIMTNVQYFIKEQGATTIWVIADAQTKDGVNLIKNALTYVPKQKNARVALLLHGDSKENQILQTILSLRKKLISGVAKLIVNLLGKPDFTKITEDPQMLSTLCNGITGINKNKLEELLSSTDTLQAVSIILKRTSLLVKKGFGVETGQNLVYANGRVLGPLEGDDIFVQQDFELLQNFENNRCGYKVFESVESMNLDNIPVDGHDRFKSDIVMKVIAALSQRGQDSRTALSFRNDEHSVINLKPRTEGLSFQVDAVLDPLSKGAQKMVPVLMVLYESFNVNLKVFMNCKAKHSEMPVNRFYQYVLQPELLFDDAGNLRNDQTAATFHNLPHSALLTLIMDTPQRWMIEAVGSNQDLDNIFLGKASEMVYGDFVLENVIIEGHASDVDTQSPPRGLQFILGTKAQPEIFDTIVMANLGYFQLKAYPGSFVLQLRDGRSSQIYQIDSLEGGTELFAGQNYTVVVDSFAGTFLRTKVKRQEGQEKADLLGGEEDSDDEGGLWNSFASYVKREQSTKVTDKRIHIFSVATGLLYERFLRIMMLSVLKHTESPVKFWFLKNYLSSGFMKFLPFYAEKYGFEYELVQYQWPKWLNGQTEKQRIIWGYKILFLDVLFPLNLERIIFVDADQIVRADLKELMDMDLGGAPYAYTPFCDDRKEVEGFRFWKQGYWRNHLSGRPYHISALYVVDLKRFRKVAAGDRLRGQYQGLSQDPNSLANLDQDLPNNMIHQVEIFSLPQEWLWCETWCSDESKKSAKTIDMCNNPETKEPKLERAIRIAPEWTEYDDVIKKLQEQMTSQNKSAEKESTEAKGAAKDSSGKRIEL